MVAHVADKWARVNIRACANGLHAMRFTVAWAANDRPYGVVCTDRIDTVRRGRRTLRDTIIIIVRACSICWNEQKENRLLPQTVLPINYF